MLDALTEGTRSIVQVCHLVILAPVAMAIVAARGRWRAVVGGVAGVVLGGWIFVAGWIDITDLRLRVSAIAVMAALVALALLGRDVERGPESEPLPSSRLRQLLRSPWSTGAVTAAIAVVVAQWWRPCVGVELGSILTNSPADPWGQLPATAGFMLGLSVPLVIIGLIFGAWQPSRALYTKISSVGASIGMVLSFSVLAGQHGEIVSRLFQWSQ